MALQLGEKPKFSQPPLIEGYDEKMLRLKGISWERFKNLVAFPQSDSVIPREYWKL
jgi:hypothetical protein